MKKEIFLIFRNICFCTMKTLKEHQGTPIVRDIMQDKVRDIFGINPKIFLQSEGAGELP